LGVFGNFPNNALVLGSSSSRDNALQARYYSFMEKTRQAAGFMPALSG
jgi:hypothetical protein